MKKFLSGLLSAALAASLLAPSAAAVGTGFTDVPAGQLPGRRGGKGCGLRIDEWLRRRYLRLRVTP